MGQPFLMNNPSKLASNWFGDKERGMATAVGSMAIPLGMLISFVLPNAVMEDSDSRDIETGKRHFDLYILIQTLLMTVLSLPALIFMQEEPPSPPSVVANDTNNHMSMKEGIKALLTNKNYMMLLLTFNFIYGVHSAVGGTISLLGNHYGYSVAINSIMCFVYLTGGIFNSFFLGTVLDKYQCYRKMIIFISIMCIITLSLHLIAMPSGNAFIECVTMMLIGSFVLPITSLSYSFAVELAFPVPETMTNGMMISVSLVWGTAMGFVSQILADVNPLFTLGLWSLSAVVSLILAIFIEEDLRRLQLDDVKHSEYIEDDEFRKQSYE